MHLLGEILPLSLLFWMQSKMYNQKKQTKDLEKLVDCSTEVNENKGKVTSENNSNTISEHLNSLNDPREQLLI